MHVFIDYTKSFNKMKYVEKNMMLGNVNIDNEDMILFKATLSI